MDLLLALVLLGLGAAPLALLSGWLSGRGLRPLGSIINGGDNATWWRSTMPWPTGVQEEDEVTWSFRRSQEPTGRTGMSARPDEADEVRIDPTHLRPRVRRR